MKYFSIIILTLFFSCNTNQTITGEQQKEFEQMARAYQITYMEGSINLDQILNGMNQDIQMWENGKLWTYEDMVKFGPHLPKKAVINTYNEQVLINENTGYDFVTLQYISSTSGDTLRETASRIWNRIDDQWKIVKMSNLIAPENCD